MEQRSAEWHQARKGRVTASMAGALLGLSPHTSQKAAWRSLVRSVHGQDDDMPDNPAMAYGRMHEDGARQEYIWETGNAVTQVGFVPVGQWAGASPDGLVGEDGLIEIKCPFSLRQEGEHKSINDQPHYYAQVQFQLWCTEREWCDFWQWSPRGTMLERVIADVDWFNENIPVLEGIWDDAQVATLDDVERVLVTGDLSRRLVAEYFELKEAADNAKDRQAEIMKMLRDMAGDRDAMIGGHKLTKVERAGAVAYAKALKALAPDADLEPYRGKPFSHWRLS